MDTRYFKQSGFSLVEVTVALFILGLLVMGGVGLLSAERGGYALKQSRESTDDLKQHLLNFLAVNHYLPCPDINGNGYENRSSTTFTCELKPNQNSPFGGVPFHELGIQKTQVKDAWGNPIRYAINSEAIQADKICDPHSAASYFCNRFAPAFSLQKTPPFTGERGAGNLYVCNEKASRCSGKLSSAKLAKNGVSVVLVAYNQDGQTVLENCNGASTVNRENCDDDIYYQQSPVSVTRSAITDDYIQTISGYEIKRVLPTMPTTVIGTP